MSYFQLFDLAERFEVDQGKLAAAYRELQRAVHPDRFATAPERERGLALHKAAEINDAFQTLKSPLRRAQYLLTLREFPLASEQQTFRDPEFLMQQMSLREELSELAEQDDPDAALDKLLDHVSEAIDSAELQLGKWLDENTEQSNAHAADGVRKLQFFYKLRSEAEQLEERLLSV